MELEVFQIQIKRLKETYGDKAYPEERIKVLWAQFKNVQNHEFVDTVTMLIANHRQPPMLGEIEKEIQLAINRTKDGLRDYTGPRNFQGLLKEAEKNNKNADKEFVRACVQLLTDKLNRKYTMEQFLEGCAHLDKTARLL
ncbi:MAG TPA: hypothetical protein PK473_03110 [Nitrosomonas sp.]|nr:hypothetical protein [Agitococcus sp.]HNA70000.1 hypothetical protein [Nitrosomonas sp.]